MKPKINRGGGFRGVLEYVCGKGDSPDIVGGNMSGKTPRQLAAEFGVTRKIRPDIEKPVWHCSLSLPVGENVDPDKWREIAEDMVRGMGMNPARNLFVAVRHHDTEHDHIHIAASRIGLDGKIWLGKKDVRTAIDVAQDLEKKHGLQQTQGYYLKAEKGLTSGEIQMAGRTGEPPPKKRLQALIKKAAQGNPTAAQFAERLVMRGVEVRPNIAENTGALSGFSFGLDGHSFAGSKLGPNFSWTNKKQGLQKQGVSYEQERDREQLERITGASGGQPADPDNIRIAVDAGDDQRPVESVPELDGRPVEGVVIKADRPDSEPPGPAPGDDRAAGDGGADQYGDRHENPGFSGAPTVEREIGGNTSGDPKRGFESLRSADWGTDGTGPQDQPSDGKIVGPGKSGAEARIRGSEERKRRLEELDREHRKAIDELAGKRQSRSERERESERNQRQKQPAVGERGRSVSDGINMRDHLDRIGALVDRYEITPQRARQAIDRQIAEHPAPARPEGRKVPTGPLSRWFAATKMKIARFIQKARDYFNDKATESAVSSGWKPNEIRGSGFEGGALERLEAAQAAKAAQKARLLEQAERMKKITEAQTTKKPLFRDSPTTPPEPPDIDFGFDDDDEPSGPGLG